LFEYAWYKTRRFRDGDDERDAHYPELRRYDAKKNGQGGSSIQVPSLFWFHAVVSTSLVFLH